MARETSPADPVSRGRSWRPAPTLAILRSELDLGWPNRSTASDGFIGDESHQSRQSDHNPDQDGYVRALDITADPHGGPEPSLLAEFLRRVGATDSQRLNPGGFVIYNRRIASARNGWVWRPYGGQDPHVSHIHLTCSSVPLYYKIGRPWDVVRRLDQMLDEKRRAPGHPQGMA